MSHESPFFLSRFDLICLSSAWRKNTRKNSEIKHRVCFSCERQRYVGTWKEVASSCWERVIFYHFSDQIYLTIRRKVKKAANGNSLSLGRTPCLNSLMKINSSFYVKETTILICNNKETFWILYYKFLFISFFIYFHRRGYLLWLENESMNILCFKYVKLNTS